MNRNSVTCLIAALIIFAVSTPLLGNEVLPGDDPYIFRTKLHQDYIKPAGGGPITIPNVLPFVPRVAEKAASSFGDLLISESVAPANFTQNNVDLAALKGGRTVVVWADYRQGPAGIYLQLLDNAGEALGDNVPLIMGDEFEVTHPKVCADTNGNFYCVWRENINGYLQAARFDSLANLITSVFFVSDTTQINYAGEFSAACLPDGRLAVVWENHSGYADISVQLFTAAGDISTLMTLANSDGLSINHWSPAIAATNDGDFAVVWEDYRNGSADIFFRRYNSFGIPYTSEFSLADVTAPDSGRFLPSLTFSPTDGYVAAWVDLRDRQNIFLQQLTSAGTPVGGNTILTATTADMPNWEIDLDVNSSDNLLAAWTIYAGDKKIMLQRFASGLQFDGSPQLVSAADENLRYKPSVAGNYADNISLAWNDSPTGTGDIFGAFFANDGSEVKAAFEINGDAAGSPSIEPRAVSIDQYEWAIVFTDQRRDAGDIMLQSVYVGGDLVGVNRMINADAPGGYQSQPAIASADDVLLISWTDERDESISGRNVFCTFLRPGYNLTEEIVVNDDYNQSFAHYNSAVAINGNGVSLVVWTDTRMTVPKVYGQLFDQDFQKIGANFLVGPGLVTEYGEMPVASADADGNFVVSYLNRVNPVGPSVEIKRVTSAGVISSLFEFVSDQGSYRIDGFDAGVNNNNEVILVWHAFLAAEAQLYMTVFDYSGTVISPTTAVITYSEPQPSLPDISVDNLGYILIAWLETGISPATPFRQLFADDLTPISANLPITSDMRFAQPPAAAGFRGRGVFVWSDARENGLNVYASQEIYEPTDIDDDLVSLPANFGLSQNYPNPFNPSTVIRFSLNKAGHTRLEVFNLLGQKVRTLVDDHFPAGNHNVLWNGKTDDGLKVSSGIYLYRLESGDQIRSRKMTLLK